jgi:predicted metalloendopeptidase
MLRLAGAGAAAAEREAGAILRLETALAQASMTRVEQRDPNAIYNRMTLARLSELAPSVDWKRYLQMSGAPAVDSINVAQPKFIAAVNEQLAATPLDDWKAYLRWHLLTKTANTLPSAFDDENFRFRGTFLLGQKQQLPRWQRCVSRVNQEIGEALGQAYVEKKFGPESKRKATELVDNLVAALHDNIISLDWMTDPTKQQALAKLNAFVRKIGYPDQWRDYSALTVTSGPYAANVLAANAFEHRRDLAKIGKPVDRAEWYMTPPTFNAYYNPPMNEIVFPAGILQWPMFDINQDDAFNYGAIGSVIGHELTHGFDDEGSQYDAQGNVRNWWTPEDRTRFEERAECIVRQFDKYEIEPGLAHTGKLVAGESIADLGGVIIAWNAWKRSLQGKPQQGIVGGFTPEQRFFLGYARTRASNMTPEAMRLRVATDPHPINRFRVNGPLSNMPEFAAAFGCSANDPMVRQDRCEVW